MAARKKRLEKEKNRERKPYNFADNHNIVGVDVKRILVTGAGGIGGVNFIRALRLAEKQTGTKMFIAGTEFNQYYAVFPDVDVISKLPRHDDPLYIESLLALLRAQHIEFLHPHPSSEAGVVAENRTKITECGVKLFLPARESIAPDKTRMVELLKLAGVGTPETVRIFDENDVAAAFKQMNSPLWMRAMVGVGGRLSLKVATVDEALAWLKLNLLQGRVKRGEFIIQEMLPGRDLAFDSLWFEGHLITSYARERLEYPFKHISLSGITGTPAVSRTVHDARVNEVGIGAVRALEAKPHGFYSVDLKEDAVGAPKVTEVDGKWHTTAPLWGYSLAKVLGQPQYNLAYNYVVLGFSGKLEWTLPKTDLFPPNYFLIRQMDSGVVLQKGDRKWRLL